MPGRHYPRLPRSTSVRPGAPPRRGRGASAPDARSADAASASAHSSAAAGLPSHGLTRDDILSPSAHDRARNKHRSGIAWNKFAVRAIVINPRYTGYQVWNKQRKDEVLIDVEDVASATRRGGVWRMFRNPRRPLAGVSRPSGQWGDDFLAGPARLSPNWLPPCQTASGSATPPRHLPGKIQGAGCGQALNQDMFRPPPSSRPLGVISLSPIRWCRSTSQ